jgi:hypothetical protein
MLAIQLVGLLVGLPLLEGLRYQQAVKGLKGLLSTFACNADDNSPAATGIAASKCG